MRHRLALMALTAALAAAPPALAQARGDVYLNGVKVNNTLSNQRFDKAEVVFDARGDVYITVPGVKVFTEDAARSQQALPAIPAKTWWLVAQQSAPGMTQYDIEVHVNGKLVKRVKNDEPQEVIDLASFLKPGQNEVSFTAIKDLAQTRRSFDAAHTFEIVIGQGAEQGPQGLVISSVAARYRRSAADVDNHTATARFQVHIPTP
jgi:hypothetical protein